MPALEAWTTYDDAPTVVRETRCSTLWPKARPADRRGATRLPIEVDVDVEGAAQRFRSTTVDLSAGGMFVMTHEEMPIGAHVVLGFTLPNGAVLQVLGVVQWSRSESGSEGHAGIGVSFFFLDPEVKTTLESFCAVREPLYTDRVRTVDDLWDEVEAGITR